MKRQRRERTSYAFLMEMMWVCAFFLICACIFVMAFAKAEQMSRTADTRNQAVQAASNALEELYAAYGSATASSEDEDGLRADMESSSARIAEQYSASGYTLQITSEVGDGLLQVSVLAIDNRSQEELITLTGARAASPEGGQS